VAEARMKIWPQANLSRGASRQQRTLRRGEGPRASPSLPVFLSQWLVRVVVGLVARLFYPLRVRGLENLPRRGGVLLVSNHVSFVDWLLLTAAAARPVRFFISQEFYESPWLKPFHPHPIRTSTARSYSGVAALH
jgi:hypothetical protein